MERSHEGQRRRAHPRPRVLTVGEVAKVVEADRERLIADLSPAWGDAEAADLVAEVRAVLIQDVASGRLVFSSAAAVPLRLEKRIRMLARHRSERRSNDALDHVDDVAVET